MYQPENIQIEETIQSLHTLADWIRWGTSFLSHNEVYFGHGTDNARDEAYYLVLGSLHVPWSKAKDSLSCRLSLTERRHLLTLFKRRVVERMPAAYLLGEAWFADLPFYVDENVLVPRSPLAEVLVEEFAPWIKSDQVVRILDLCTGSGCIGITCAQVFPSAEVALTDISDEALVVARRNVKRHRLGERVSVLKSDVFNDLPEQSFDIIVSNPPYVDAQDMATLPEEYRREPVLGLAAGEDGLEIVRRILDRAGQYLSEHGILVVEVGNSQPALMETYPKLPFTWLEFEQGGSGVFVLTAKDLRDHACQRQVKV